MAAPLGWLNTSPSAAAAAAPAGPEQRCRAATGGRPASPQRAAGGRPREAPPTSSRSLTPDARLLALSGGFCPRGKAPWCLPEVTVQLTRCFPDGGRPPSKARNSLTLARALNTSPSRPDLALKGTWRLTGENKQRSDQKRLASVWLRTELGVGGTAVNRTDEILRPPGGTSDPGGLGHPENVRGRSNLQMLRGNWSSDSGPEPGFWDVLLLTTVAEGEGWTYHLWHSKDVTGVTQNLWETYAPGCWEQRRNFPFVSRLHRGQTC